MVNTRYSNLPNFLSPGDFDKPCGCVFCRGKLLSGRGVKASWASAGLQKLMADAEIFTNYMAVRFGAGFGFRPVVVVVGEGGGRAGGWGWKVGVAGFLILWGVWRV